MTKPTTPTVIPLQSLLEPALIDSAEQLAKIIEKETLSIQKDLENLLHVIEKST